jgi:lysophospholipase L1-like esterase
MKIYKLLYILLALLFLPANIHSAEFYSIGIDRNLPGRPISLMHYQDGEWNPEPFPPALEFSANSAPCLAISPDGELWMAWAARRDGEPPRIYFSRRSGMNWSPAESVSLGSDWEETPVIAFDRSGTPWVAWSRTRDDKTNIFSAGWDGGSFAQEEMISSSITSPNINPSLGAGENNTMVLLWEGLERSFYQIYFSIRDDGWWSRENLLSPREGVGQVLPFLVDQGGQMKGCWIENGSKIYSDLSSGQWSVPYRKHSKTSIPPAPISDYRGWIIRSGTGEEAIPLRISLSRPTQVEKTGRFQIPGKYSRMATAHVYTGYGDSITYGTTPPGGDPDDHKGDCYIPLLLTLLRTDYPADTFTIYNGGYPGATTHQLLEGSSGGSWPCPGIISAITTSQCSKILIMGGTNDVSDHINPSITSNNLSAMIDRARGLGSEPILGTIIPRCNSTPLNNDTTTLVSTYIIPLAESKSCRLANPWQNYQDNPNWCDDYLTWWDKLHPYYPAGSQPIADAWYDAIAVYSPTPTPVPTPLTAIIDSGDYNGDGTSDIALFRQSSGL